MHVRSTQREAVCLARFEADSSAFQKKNRSAESIEFRLVSLFPIGRAYSSRKNGLCTFQGKTGITVIVELYRHGLGRSKFVPDISETVRACCAVAANITLFVDGKVQDLLIQDQFDTGFGGRCFAFDLDVQKRAVDLALRMTPDHKICADVVGRPITCKPVYFSTVPLADCFSGSTTRQYDGRNQGNCSALIHEASQAKSW